MPAPRIIPKIIVGFLSTSNYLTKSTTQNYTEIPKQIIEKLSHIAKLYELLLYTEQLNIFI